MATNITPREWRDFIRAVTIKPWTTTSDLAESRVTDPGHDHTIIGCRAAEANNTPGGYFAAGEIPVIYDALRKENVQLRAAIADNARANSDMLGMIAQQAEIIAGLQRRLTVETGDHDYHGPTESVPHPTNPDKTVRRAIPDPVHERFHGAVGDVIAGRVMPEARRQMQEALKAAPKANPGLPPGATRFSAQDIGIKTPRW